MLALLALGCFPVLAQADSSGIQYSDSPPTATGNNEIPSQSKPSNESSKGSGGSASSSGADSSGSSRGGSAAGGSSSGSGGGSGTASDGGTGQQGSPGKGAYNGSVGPGKATSPGAESSAAEDDGGGGSSPLVPILIAIAVLAAISLGVVMLRQRRQRGPGSPVSPEVG